jgi:hypothetical protein
MLALIVGSGDLLHAHLKEAVRLYAKDMAKQPNEPIGVTFLPGLMLCRVAIDHGLTVADGPCLPVRLLPNYRPAAR